MVLKTGRYTSCKPVVEDTTSGMATDSSVAALVMVTCRTTVCHHHSCLPAMVALEAEDRFGCPVVVSTCPPRPVTGWLLPRPLPREAATTTANRTNRSDTGPDSHRRNSTNWNGASAKPITQTSSCVKR